MRVPARIYATEKLLSTMDKAVLEQAANVATLPGIVGYSYCMPDGHSGYGFPIGGMAAFDTEKGVISPGGIGFDINCGMRLVATSLTFEELKPRLAELVDRFTEEHIENTPLYQLLLAALGALSRGRDLDLELRAFELHLLRLVGYQPQLFHCVACSRPLEPGRNAFSAAAGGVLCPGCGLGESLRREVSLDALKVLRFLQTNDFAAFARLRVGPTLNEELEALLGEYIRYLLERNLKSAEFLQTLRRQSM
jgi:hypothetical protein